MNDPRNKKIYQNTNHPNSLSDIETELRLIIDNIPSLVAYIDTSIKYRLVNQSYQNFFGISGTEVIGKHVREGVGVDVYEILKKHIDIVLTGKKTSYEEHYKNKNGNVRILSANLIPYIDAKGSQSGYLVIIDDITEQRNLQIQIEKLNLSLEDKVISRTKQLQKRTAKLNQEINERKKAEEYIRRSETLLSSTQQMAKIGGWENDLESNTMFWTDELYRIHELHPDRFKFLENKNDDQTEHSEFGEFTSIDEAIRLSVDCYNPKDQQMLMEAFRKCEEEARPYDFELPFTTVRGNRKWVRTTAMPVVEKNKVVKIKGLLEDITDRKQIEEDLKESEEKYRSILESMEEGYFEVDLAGTFTLTNESMAKILGYSNNELLGVNNRSYMDPSTAVKVYKIFNSIYKSRNPQKYFNYKINRKDGQKRTLEASTALRLNNEGIPCGFSGVARDVTEQKKSRELMIQTEKMMSLGGLAAGMAHELNNPLGGILQGVQNIQRRLSTDLKSNFEISEQTGINLQNLQLYLEKKGIISMFNGIKDSGKKASEIISNMLQFSRRSESQMAPTDLAELMENVLALSSKDYNLKKKFDFKNIRIIREFATNGSLIPCTETEIQQVILNLLNNAAWAMANDKDNRSPQITLRIKRENKLARIEVEDNGPGMDEETKKHIFEPFFTTKPVGEGTGLGLSVSYMIVTSHHKGTMEVESKIGEGTKFIIHLPLEK